MKFQENIAYYLSLGMDVDGRDNAGFTALHEAVTKGHHNCVKLLLEQGANANEQSTDGTRYIFNENLRKNSASTQVYSIFFDLPIFLGLFMTLPRMVIFQSFDYFCHMVRIHL